MSFAQDLELDLWKYCIKHKGKWWAKLLNVIPFFWWVNKEAKDLYIELRALDPGTVICIVQDGSPDYHKHIQYANHLKKMQEDIDGQSSIEGEPTIVNAGCSGPFFPYPNTTHPRWENMSRRRERSEEDYADMGMPLRYVAQEFANAAGTVQEFSEALQILANRLGLTMAEVSQYTPAQVERLERLTREYGEPAEHEIKEEEATEEPEKLKFKPERRKIIRRKQNGS